MVACLDNADVSAVLELLGDACGVFGCELVVVV